MGKLKKVSDTIKNTSYKIHNLVKRKDPRMMYAILALIIISIIAAFTYLYFTKIWNKEMIILQDKPIDGRKGIRYTDMLVLSDKKRTYSSSFCFWINLRSMSNMQETETNYILSYEMNHMEGIRSPYFNIIYGDMNNTKLNQIMVSFKNMENTTEHITVRNIELQKWLCIQIVIKDITIDFYMNGELIKSKTLNYVPILSNKGDLIIGKDNGFNGTMSNLTYFNYALNEFDLRKYYNNGPFKRI
jgi:hypothetical protein